MQEQVAVEKTPLVPENGEDFDLIVIGAGPAGMAASVGAGRARLKTLVIDKALPGGQATTSYRVYNYLGFPGGILGSDLAVQMEEHMNMHNIYYTCEAVDDLVNVGPQEKAVKTALGHIYKSKEIISAVGLEPKMINSTFV